MHVYPHYNFGIALQPFQTERKQDIIRFLEAKGWNISIIYGQFYYLEEDPIVSR